LLWFRRRIVSSSHPFAFQLRIIPDGRTEKEEAGTEKKYGEQNREIREKRFLGANCRNLRRIFS
jgi:hypothetical protein